MQRMPLRGEKGVTNTIELKERILRHINLWISLYMTMKKVLEYIQRHSNENNDVSNTTIEFKDRINKNLRTHNLPTSRSDVDAVFQSVESPFQLD